MFEANVYKERRDKLRRRVRSGIILLLGNTYSPVNYPKNPYKFRQDSDFLYLFGLDFPNLAAVMDLDGSQDTIYGDDPTIDDIIWGGDLPTARELAARCDVSSVRPMGDLQSFITATIRDGRRIHILPPYRGEQILTLCDLLGIHYKSVANHVSHELVDAMIALRSVKEPHEIEELKRIAAIGYEMHVTAMRMAKPGVKEQHIAGAIEGIAATYGHMTSFGSIVSQNGQILHNEDHSQILSKGRLLLVDCGFESNMHYATDNTRTYPVGGEFTSKQLEIYNLVLKGLDHGIAMAKPEIPYLDIHLSVCRVLTEGLMELGLMHGDIDKAVESGAHALFMPHGLGHMMGIDVHDMEGLGQDRVGYDQEIKKKNQFGTGYLRFGRKLKPGFVLTVEPGIYFIPKLIELWQQNRTNAQFINFDRVKEYLDFGGIRLEDDIVITETGCELLGDKRIPITPDELAKVVGKDA